MISSAWNSENGPLTRAAARLREQPNLLACGRENIERWAKLQGRMAPAYQEWLQIIEQGLEAVLAILEGITDNDQRLRSSTPFVGPSFVSEEERQAIYAGIRERVNEEAYGNWP